MAESNHINELRRDVLRRVAVAFMHTNEPAREVEAIPFVMRPKNHRHDRCCIYQDRAILRYRCMAAMGFLPEDEEDDDSISLGVFAARALQRNRPSMPIISACNTACHGCVKVRYFVTNVCQKCIAHPCVGSCRFGAISIFNGQSQIDASKCRNCGMCQGACPFGAIVKLSVPCEEACPVGAITKGADERRAEIDFVKCISCGRCMRACPFGAVLERSEIVDVLRLFSRQEHVTALVAPAIAGQFPVPLGKVFSGLKRLGFSAVMEVAAGADITSVKEAGEFVERMERGDKFMTTSCCPGYVQAVRRSMPEVAPFVSDTSTPMHYTAELARELEPETRTVFIGPCVAKRVEGLFDTAVNHVLTFEELGALFAAADIDLAECPDEMPETTPSSSGRRYAVTGNVAAAVKEMVGDRVEVKAVQINGLSLKNIRLLRSFATGNCPGNLVEVMACEGGCVGGSGVLGERAKATREVEALAGKASFSKPAA